MSGWYNGYSPDQRKAKSKARKRLERNGHFPGYPPGPCSICGDPGKEIEPHSEDYSEPYSWSEPEVYSLCYTCHRIKLHKRFANSVNWQCWKAHIRRGGYSSDLIRQDIANELDAYKQALRRGERFSLRVLRSRAFPKTPWWESLTENEDSLRDPAYMPRPARP
jgi:hypothetical protein